MLAQAPLLWTWDQTSVRLTSRCAHVKSNAKKKSENEAKRKRAYAQQDEDGGTSTPSSRKPKPTKSSHSTVQRSSNIDNFEVIEIDTQGDRDEESSAEEEGDAVEDLDEDLDMDQEEEPGAPPHIHITHFHLVPTNDPPARYTNTQQPSHPNHHKLHIRTRIYPLKNQPNTHGEQLKSFLEHALNLRLQKTKY
jgi:hypothetical protein